MRALKSDYVGGLIWHNKWSYFWNLSANIFAHYEWAGVPLPGFFLRLFPKNVINKQQTTECTNKQRNRNVMAENCIIREIDK